MKQITKILTEIVSQAFADCGYPAGLGAVTVSDRPELCQFQCNGSFSAAKQFRKAPFMVADEVVAKLAENPVFSKAETVKPGFINMSVTDSFILELANELYSDENAGIPQANAGKTVVIDYGGPNVAKPLHIGHLRSAIIGETTKRMARATGMKVLGDVHLGDWGLQIGLVIAELRERNPEWNCFSEDYREGDAVPELTAEQLNEIYPFASAKSKTDDSFKEKAHIATYELQSGKAGYIALWKEIIRVSVADLKTNYSRLDVDFDLWYGESDSDKYIDELVRTLEDKGLLHESEGAMVVDVAEESDKSPMPPVIIKKSDNSAIYATTDLATIIQRNRDFTPDEIWYVVDKRQGLHFEQVFRCARKAELVPESTKLVHMGFGTMNGTDGKPYKTRDGGVMQLSVLIDTAKNAALERLSPDNFGSEEERIETAEKLGIASIKFGDLINHRSKDYIFDLDKFLSAEGKTGAYLLYMMTRINSVLAKAGADDDKISFGGIYSDSERDLLLLAVKNGEAVVRAVEEKAPNYLCESAYQIAVAFAKFYAENHIISEQDEVKKQSWLSVCKLTKRVLEKCCELLGIEPVKKM